MDTDVYVAFDLRLIIPVFLNFLKNLTDFITDWSKERRVSLTSKVEEREQTFRTVDFHRTSL